jgi:tetratricopeptide (TPR) repeat protein
LHAQSELERGRELFNKGNYAEAKNVFEQLLNKTNYNAEANYYLGSIYLRFDRDADKAIEYIEKAVDADPGNAQYHLILSSALGAKAMQSNVIKQAMLAPRIKSELEKAVELDPNNLDARTGLMQFYIMAPGIIGGSIDKAKLQAEALLKLSVYRGYMAYAAIYNYEDDLGTAEEYYRKAALSEPAKPGPYHQLGYLYIKQKRYQEAIKHFKKMVECDPGNANSYDSLGDGYLANDQLDEAIESYTQAVATDPKFAPSVFNLAKCCEKKNMKQEAKDHYRRYLALVPNGSQADEARSKLKE